MAERPNAGERPAALSPSQLNRQVRRLLETEFDLLWVEGEISNLSRPASGHWYFSLKDDNAQVRCAMFRSRNQRVRAVPANGDLVRMRARVSLYEARGDFQLIGEYLEAAGAGTLQARFEALRDRLRAEGLFDSAGKRPLPRDVAHLAIVTSPSGAALQDMLQVLARRNPAIRVTVLASAVQGEAAPGQLRAAVERANRLARERSDCDFDALVVARGGGSLEDLWAFNDEGLARVIAASDLPVVVGVGHEVDVTIADFAADQRAPTPSAAAEILSEDRDEALVRLQRLKQALQRSALGRLRRERLALAALAARLRHPGERLREQAQRIDDMDLRLRRALRQKLGAQRQLQLRLATRLHQVSPAPRIRRQRNELTGLQRALRVSIERRLARHRSVHERQSAMLESLSPLAVLGRGYAILSNADGLALRRAEDTRSGERLTARLGSGQLEVEVLKTRVPSSD